MSSTVDLWPGDLRPLHLVYGVPMNPDGSCDISRGMPSDGSTSRAQIELHNALVAKIAEMDDEAKKAHLLAEMKVALRILGVTLPIAAGFIPGVGPFVSPVLTGLGSAVSEAEKPSAE